MNPTKTSGWLCALCLLLFAPTVYANDGAEAAVATWVRSLSAPQAGGDEELQRARVLALGPRAIGPLFARLEHPEPRVRRSAARLLAESVKPHAIYELELVARVHARLIREEDRGCRAALVELALELTVGEMLELRKSTAALQHERELLIQQQNVLGQELVAEKARTTEMEKRLAPIGESLRQIQANMMSYMEKVDLLQAQNKALEKENERLRKKLAERDD